MSYSRSVLAPMLAAALLVGCKTVSEPTPGPISTQVRSATETTIHTLPAAAAVAVVHTDIAKGTVIVELNGTQVGKVGAHQELNLAKYVQPGRNTMTLRWTKPVALSGQVSMAPPGSARTQVAHFSLTRTQTQRPGEYRVTFVTPPRWAR